MERRIEMSEFAYFRFATLDLLDQEEKQHKEDVIEATEEVLYAKGITCDNKISQLSQEKVKEIHQLQTKDSHQQRKEKGRPETERKNTSPLTSSFLGGSDFHIRILSYSPHVFSL